MLWRLITCWLPAAGGSAPESHAPAADIVELLQNGAVCARVVARLHITDLSVAQLLSRPP